MPGCLKTKVGYVGVINDAGKEQSAKREGGKVRWVMIDGMGG